MKARIDRKTLLIDRPFQVYFLVYTVGIALTVSLIYFAASRFFFLRFLEQGKDLGLPANHAFFQFLETQQTTLDLALLFASLIVITVLILYGMYLSNRIAGPIYQLKKHLSDYQNGKEYSDIQFREKDFFPELAQSVNQSIHHAEKK